MQRSARVVALWLAVASTAVAAEVGRVEVITGKAQRLTADGRSSALKAGARVSVGETLRVVDGNLKLRLNDQSVLMLGAGAELRVDAAEFQGLERRRFSAALLAGSVWARVKKALVGSERNFEVTTERAVAGVRGTEFRVDLRRLGAESYLKVSVWEGSVYVRGQVRAPRISVAMDTEAIRSPDAVRETKRRSPAPAPRAPSRSAAAAPPAAPPAMPAAAPAPPVAAMPPPPPAAAPSGGTKTVERVLELAPGEAVLVGPDDDWQPEPGAPGDDALARFARAQK